MKGLGEWIIPKECEFGVSFQGDENVLKLHAVMVMQL